MLESGLSGAELYARVAALLHVHGVTRLVGVGETISRELKIMNYELES
ncbi:MAG: hypothetical protein WKG07_05955 [Hymenobacter sp.]